ncbi:MAG TPA: LD-carboxypeptidase [Candidatus Dojkabacteria bacterium]|nr:LD-carboxypeptidase [Candidatus Dojkabacteria bacterium]
MNIYVCSTSAPLPVGENDLEVAKKFLESFGHTVTYSGNMFARTGNTAGTIEQRIEDLHEGFANDKYDLVLAATGGFNSNEILPYIDYDLISKSKKTFCGHSDNTTLCLNLYQKSKIRSVYGLCYEYLRFSKSKDELIDYNDALISAPNYKANLVSQLSTGKVLRGGEMKGTLIGGNLSVINWLLGTKYGMELTDDSILFIEDDEDSHGSYWQMYLRKLEMLGYFNTIKGLIIGKTPFTEFNEGADMRSILDTVLKDYKFPVIYDAYFGHLRDNTMLNIELGINIALNV